MRKFWRRAAVKTCALLAVGAIYEQLGQRRDQARLPRIGRAVDIGGRTMNISCSGTGPPTVILDTGGSAPGYSNSHLQKLIAAETQTCWFDRAGLGWSDPSPVLQTSGAVSSDLRNLLQAARIEPPYILVGQSFSGFNVRMFAARYRHDVLGVVLMDSVQEDQQQYEPRSTLAPVNRLPNSVRSVLCTAIPWAAKIGVLRLLLSTSGGRREIPGFTASEVATLNALQSQPKASSQPGVAMLGRRAPTKLGPPGLLVAFLYSC